MSMPLEQLKAEAMELPIRERASLAHRLLQSLDEDAIEDPVETECRLTGHRQTFGHTDQESATPSEPAVPDTKPRYTPKQGQYLSFIYYTKIRGLPPSEADIQRYFRVSPPAVHQMILNLEAKGLIERVPRTPRSVRLTVPRSDLPALE